HEDPGTAGRGHHRGHLRIGEAAGDVVDDGRAGRQGGGRDLGPGGIDADRYAGRGQSGHHREDPGDLGLRVDPLGARTGGLTADVDDIRTRGPQGDAVPDRGVDVRVAPTVRERIGGHVQNAHHYRVILGEQEVASGHRMNLPGGAYSNMCTMPDVTQLQSRLYLA